MKRMVMVAFAVAIGASMTGCVALKSTMVDPKTGATYDCSSVGGGLVGVPIAFGMRQECEEKLKKMGLVPLEEFTKSGGTISGVVAPPSVLSVDSDPPGASVYAGPDKDNAKSFIGTTPLKLTNQKGRLWGRECYKLTKDGFIDSTAYCYEEVFGDRTVPVKLEAKAQQQAEK